MHTHSRNVMCCLRLTQSHSFFTCAQRSRICITGTPRRAPNEFIPVRARRYEDSLEDGYEPELPCEPAGHAAIATGSVQSCKEFWRSFVRISVVMEWIDNGYHLMWTRVAPSTKDMANAPSANEHHDFFSSVVAEMLAANVVTLLPPGEKPTVVSPLGVVPTRGKNKFRLTSNMRHVNRHMGKKVFKFVGLKDLADLAEKGDYAVSYDLMSGY